MVRTPSATHGRISATPAGEVHIEGTNSLNRNLFLQPHVARDFAHAILEVADDLDPLPQSSSLTWPLNQLDLSSVTRTPTHVVIQGQGTCLYIDLNDLDNLLDVLRQAGRGV